MNMILTPEYLGTFITLIVVALAVLIWRIRGMDKRLKNAEAFIRGLIAHSMNVPLPADPAIHQGWLDRFNELDDCPRKTAYKNRLIEVGMMNEDGEVINAS